MGANFSYNSPTHHTGRPIPSVPFPNLTGTPAINTPDLNLVTQTLNRPPSSKKAIIKNIQAQMDLMQQQLNALIQDNSLGIGNPRNNYQLLNSGVWFGLHKDL